MSSTRLLALDALRGLAVFLMIEQHMGVWLWRGPGVGEGLRDYPVLVGFNALGGGAAPLFVTLAGVGSALFVAVERPRTDATLVRRGLALIAFGLVLNVLTPSWFTWGSWFVLHMMGFALMLAPLWRRLPTSALVTLLVALLVATVATQNWLETPAQLTNPRMRDLTVPGGALRLALAEGQFPILPWLGFYLGGFCAGRWIAAARDRAVTIAGATCLAIGAVMGSWFALGLPPSRSDWAVRAFRLRLGFYPASPTFVLLLLGAVLLTIAAVLAYERRRGLDERGPMVTLGRASLTLLMVHVPLFREATRPVGLWRDVSASTALGMIVGFVVVCVLLTRWWHGAGYRYGAEWLLRRVGGR